MTLAALLFAPNAVASHSGSSAFPGLDLAPYAVALRCDGVVPQYSPEERESTTDDVRPTTVLAMTHGARPNST